MTDELIELRYGLDSFRSDWRHCSLGSDFLAETAFQTPQSKQLASAAINEVLELAFRLGANASKSWVKTTVDSAHTLALALDFKIRPESINEVSRELMVFLNDPVTYYESQLGQGEQGVFFGLAYLVSDIQALVSLALEGDVLQVRARLPLNAASVEER